MCGMSSVKITITLPVKILEIIDKTRGLIPRSTYIAFLLEEKNSKRPLK